MTIWPRPKSRILEAVDETLCDLQRPGFAGKRLSQVMPIGILPQGAACLLRKAPDDAPGAHFAERCLAALATPPAADWDGAYEQTEK
jgi:hypothetical protein